MNNDDKLRNISLVPDLPWVKGVNAEYRSFNILVKVCQDNNGLIWSVHEPETEQDKETCQTLPSYGVEQMAYALLSEGVRREAFLQVLLAEQDREGMLDKWESGNTAERAQLESELTAKLITGMTDEIRRSALPSIQAVFAMLTQNH